MRCVMCKSAYLHVPFCKDICAYCDFTRCRYHAGLAEKWLKTIENEIKQKLKGVTLDTFYIGGGTPSALSCHQLSRLLMMLKPYTRTCEEFTMEANVDSLDIEKIQLCKENYINRISLGVQSLQPELLKMIKRNHNREDILRCIKELHSAGIDNISIDLIYGLPNQTMQMWKDDLKDIVEHFDIQHISLYALTIEEHSEFGRLHIKNIDEDIEADMYEYAVAYLKQNGFEHYEISNFAKAGKYSKHNMAYWDYDDFIGMGMGASGKQQHQHYDNTKNMQTYFEKGAAPTIIKLNKSDEIFENIMMSLRTKKGLNIHQFEKRYEISFLKQYHKELKPLLDQHLLEHSDGYIHATEQGMEILNEILLKFLPDE